ncbi:response regulator transcription factor [Variovorax sp. Sphag1AA]|uniref:response regulator n=1 Tax=Variovorax sp. Sphag1AA TaxID=2587027 RepID=UPI001608034A|nr:response regulator transcription factor [Variovorax sp. Sphag1AA]MBB3178777.1 DNA-binding NarL/FixJ family response regulator [Variovorax sp. Sphag1AA]
MESATNRVRVLCVDDHPTIRTGVAALLARDPSLELVGEAAGVEQAVQQLEQLRPDVVLTDMRLPDGTALDVIAAARGLHEATQIVVLTESSGDVGARRALAAGAKGYILKSRPGSDIVAAIRGVKAGHRVIDSDVSRRMAAHAHERDLSEREIQVLRLVSQGLANKEIGKQLLLSEGTVKNYLAQILSKLGAADRTNAVVLALSRGILGLP